MSTQGFTPYSKVELTDFSEVRITYQVATAKLDSSRKIMWTAFAGDYGHGAGGNGDARYMEAMCNAAVELVDPDGLIFDFTDLNYDWGDQLSRVFDVALKWFDHNTAPFALVLGPGCRVAVRSLLADDGWACEELGWIFETMSDAQKYVETIMGELQLAADQ